LFLFRAIKRKKPGLLAPIVPLGFILTYQMDSAYGTLIYRMRGENILNRIASVEQLETASPFFYDNKQTGSFKSLLMSLLTNIAPSCEAFKTAGKNCS